MARIQRLTAAIAAVIAGGLTLVGCAPGSAGAESAAPSATPRASVAGSAAPTPIPSTQTPETSVSETTITITVEDTTITANLHASAATSSLLAQLPLELSFEDFGGQEKIARLPAPLALDGMPSGGSAEPGMIGYYAPDQALVLYYDSVGYYNGIIPLGTFDDVATVRDAPPFTGTVAAN
jgi:hypothetical protein